MTTEEMEKKLMEAYPNSTVAVIDSRGDQHHFEVRIKNPDFDSLSRLERHKAVMNVFDDQLKSGEIHALSIKTI